MLVHNIIDKSKVNGPGTRYTIWFRGCSIRCPGCANKHIWDCNGGTEMSPQDLFSQVQSQKDIDGISITGGEPLDQYEDLLIFLKLCKGAGIEVFLTSGHTLEDIRGNYPEILDLVDILIDGPFEEDRLDNTPAWRGSTNQGINLLTDRAQKYQDYKPEYMTEMIFHQNGNATVTGFAVPDFLKK